ncbi:hypothetical protein O0I10_010986 [Lichtheimia ornata]|uniref:Uncharacterized protein n=1 Tax=Lichtheimia ornata TaxID=688661 RepID=A0AAD7UU73_9FUNG|nr:uncharacterized protein O0I10_010986 [Lichtheimia ornata]KAJ8653335.1 hypothetical protein O0I10_010986 [Lichtheimia ornata]
MAIISVIQFTLLLATTIIVWAQQAKVRDSDLPYAINDLRLKPDFCAGFRITYPAKHGEKLIWGEMGYLSWEVDTEMEKSPDLITRIRLVDDIGRNTQLIGENITIRTHDNKGALVFPVNVHYVQGLQNYRIAVQHPGEAIHCVYESVPLNVVPRGYERYTNHDSAIPAFAVPNARRIMAA